MRSLLKRTADIVGPGRPSGPDASAGPTGAGDAEREHRCPGLRDALRRALDGDAQPRVLDLGSRSGPTAVFLAGVGARVSVDLFDPPSPIVAGTDDDTGATPPLEIDHADGAFDLVMAWDRLDFTPPDGLEALFAELARVLAPGGAAIVLARDRPTDEPGTPGPLRRYEVRAEDLVVSRPTELVGPRWSHPSRKIEQALGPLVVRNMHLQRERVREYVVGRPVERR